MKRVEIVECEDGSSAVRYYEDGVVKIPDKKVFIWIKKEVERYRQSISNRRE